MMRAQWFWGVVLAVACASCSSRVVVPNDGAGGSDTASAANTTSSTSTSATATASSSSGSAECGPSPDIVCCDFGYVKLPPRLQRRKLDMSDRLIIARGAQRLQ